MSVENEMVMDNDDQLGIESGAEVKRQIDAFWQTEATPKDVVDLRKIDLPFLRERLVGMTPLEAEFCLADFDVYTRIRSIDGVFQSMTADVKPWRIDIDLRDGKIVGTL